MPLDDPVKRVLEDLGKMRGQAFNEMIRLPAPTPIKDILQEIDQILGRTETEIRYAQFSILAPLKLIEPGVPQKWAEGIRNMLDLPER